MPAIYERSGSRQFKVDGLRSSYQYLYRCKDYATDDAALTALKLVLPTSATVDGVLLNSRLIAGKEDLRTGDFNFQIDFKHESNTEQLDLPIAEDDEKLTFAFSGGPTFFTRAISQTKNNPTTGGKTARDVGNAINVKTDGSVEGAEIAIPDFGFTVSTRKDIGSTAAAINAWMKARIEQVWTTNNAAFRTLAIEDCLLKGFSGRQVSGGLFDIDFDFGAVIGEDYSAAGSFDTGRRAFTLGLVPGFRLIWVQYDAIEDTTDKVIVPEGRGAYVAKVFETSNFANLGIAT